MTVESDCAIAIVTLKIASFSTNDKQYQNQSQLACACDFCPRFE